MKLSAPVDARGNLQRPCQGRAPARAPVNADARSPVEAAAALAENANAGAEAGSLAALEAPRARRSGVSSAARNLLLHRVGTNAGIAVYTLLGIAIVVLIFLGALTFVNAARRGNRVFKWSGRTRSPEGQGRGDSKGSRTASRG